MELIDEEIAKTVEHIAFRWKGRNMVSLKRIVPLLAEGRPISIAKYAKAIDKDIRDAEHMVENGRVGLDNDGRIIEWFGISLEPTPHRIVIEGVALFSCCAMVSQMVPLLVGKDAEIESVDPTNNRLITVRISGGVIQSIEPKDAVGTFVRTIQEEVMRDVRSSFCENIRHLTNARAAEEFVKLKADRYIVSIDQLQSIARQFVDDLWT